MVVLDNLVVTTALPSIRADLGGGDPVARVDGQRLHADVRRAAADRRRARRPLRPPAHVRASASRIFTAASAAAALAPTTGALIAARALQGAGAAIVTPLTLTLLAERVPGRASAAWRSAPGRASPASASRSARWSAAPSSTASPGTGSSGSTCRSASSLRPAGAAPADRVPRARAARSTCPASALAGAGLLGHRLRHRPRRRARLDDARTVLGSLIAGARRCWPRSWPGSCARRRRCCRCASSARAPSAASNGVSLAMYFGVFGSIFLLAQFFQVAQGYSPLEAGLRTLPWTGMPMFVAPIAGLLSRPDRLAAADGRPAWRCRRSRSAGWPSVSTPDRALRRARDPVHHGRHRHGARVRARPPTPCSAPCARRRPARRRARPTRSARSAACSASPCWPGVRRQRLLRLAAGVHRRHDERVWVGAAVLAARRAGRRCSCPGKRRARGRGGSGRAGRRRLAAAS